MNRIRYVATIFGLIAIPLWSISQIFLIISQIHSGSDYFNSQISPFEILLVLHIFVLVGVLVICQQIFLSRRRSSFRGLFRLFQQPITWMSASLMIAPSSQHSQVVKVQKAEGLPVNGILSPTIAAGVLAYVLRRRREQIQDLATPDRLTESEVQSLDKIRRCAQDAEINAAIEIDLVSNSEVVQIVRAVDRKMPETETSESVATEWALVVKLFGYPTVENEFGDTAQFRKRRALELLTWLALNRDRSRRSAARTAMWDSDITDSTFSTIVSDMRRGLTEIGERSLRSDWVPTTYSDEIPLNPRVITDDVLMAQALDSFRKDSGASAEILRVLSDVRDVPFAGTAYSWADLDGTTTRLVILAVTAAMEVAHWALAVGNVSAFEIAITAGLRVFPGHDELLALQEEAKLRCHISGFHSVA